jgi:hypothetical protein
MTQPITMASTMGIAVATRSSRPSVELKRKRVVPTSTLPHALRVSAGPATVLVTSDTPAVTDWITQYFGCWWTVRPTTSADDTSGPVRWWAG